MKNTILIKENRIQLILQPETGHDGEVLKILEKIPNSRRTNFYDCTGGWSRMSEGMEDLIIIFDTEEKK